MRSKAALLLVLATKKAGPAAVQALLPQLLLAAKESATHTEMVRLCALPPSVVVGDKCKERERQAHRDGRALRPAAISRCHSLTPCSGVLRYWPSCLCSACLYTKEQHESSLRRVIRCFSAGMHGPAPRSGGADAVHR